MILGGNKTATCVCPECGTPYTFKFTEDENVKYMFYMMGGDIFIQDVFPNRTPAERELLHGGMCGKCWIEMFGNPDEEEFEEGDE